MSAALVLLLAATAACAPRHVLPEPDWLAGFSDADSVRVTQLAPGVRHSYLWLPFGPWAVHVVDIDARVCQPVIEAVKAGPPLEALAPTTELGGGALAALNADFFQAPGGTPVGAHVRAGRVLAGPGARHMYAIDSLGVQWAGFGAVDGYAVVAEDSVRIVQVNRPPAGGRHQPPSPGMTFIDHWFGNETPADSTTATVRLRMLAGAGEAQPGYVEHVGRVDARELTGASLSLGRDEVALQAVGADARAWIARRSEGDTVRWRIAVVPAEAVQTDAPRVPAVEAVGGFPMLMADGHGVYAEQTGVIAAFGPVRHPRTAVGWDAPRGRTYWVVVDGRQPPYSVGMSLPELEWLMQRVGARDAINLDGGGSTALAIGGRLVNRPTDAEGERAVANVLAVQRCR